jgi:hypothetical protein
MFWCDFIAGWIGGKTNYYNMIIIFQRKTLVAQPEIRLGGGGVQIYVFVKSFLKLSFCGQSWKTQLYLYSIA